ncbi:hypothetical protein [Streptococcus oricebi]|uniref:Uncharacterized protein n=1 Tax=Streptococcus oricebi TaxID=1547447 RepID=A0ABS5B2J7_9STRE|nr:hypothetical protein [Streptococcus oricebi]MBP2622911.1 hypothetical protein [Streptococcus oricebi]
MRQRREISFVEEYKLVTFLGILLGAIVTTCFLLWLAQNIGKSNLVPFIAFSGPMIGAYWARKLTGQKEVEEVEEVFGGSKFEPTPKSKFAPAKPDFSLFSLIISVVFSYLTIYFSEVIHYTLIIQAQYPGSDFMTVFLQLTTQILQLDWARVYLLEYWFYLSLLLVIAIIPILYYFWKFKRKQRRG